MKKSSSPPVAHKCEEARETTRRVLVFVPIPVQNSLFSNSQNFPRLETEGELRSTLHYRPKNVKSAHCLYIVHYIIRTGFCKWEKLEESTGIFCRTISLIVFTHGASICSNKESCPAWLSSCPRLLTIISSLLGPTNRSLQRPDPRFALSTNGFYPDFTLWAKNWVALAHDQDCSVLEPFFFETVTALQCCQWDDGHLQKIENSLWQNLIFNCVQGRMKSLKG